MRCGNRQATPRAGIDRIAVVTAPALTQVLLAALRPGHATSHHIRPALFQRPRIGRPRVDALQPRHRLGMAVFQSGAGGGGFQRKAHLDVGGGELVAGEPFALAKLGFPKRHVLLELRIDQRGQRLVRDLAHQRAQQRRRALRHQREQQFQQQRRHRRAFGIMQPVGIAQPLRRARRRDQPAIAVGVDDVFDDRAGFRDGVAVVGDDGRFAERMHRAQLRRRQHVGLALIARDLVGHAELFQQPQHPLRARIIEMMNGEHGGPPACFVRPSSCQPA